MPKAADFVDTAEENDRYFRRIYENIGEMIKSAKAREAAWSNTSLADFPFWDRVMVEYLIDQNKQIADVRKEMEEVKALFAPEPEEFREPEKNDGRFKPKDK